MATHADLKNITYSRIKTVDILISANDWEMAFYMMGYVLECALKATICKTLHLEHYPDNTRNKTTDGYFMTHKFDQLVIPSGMEDLFSSRGPIGSYKYWSSFTAEYPSDWPTIRYDSQRLALLNEEKIKTLYTYLIQIIAVLDSTKRW